MNGAESLIHTVRSGGVEICFANPGTTELPLVAALDAVPGVRPVLCLFEGVCSAAADGWARVAERPAMTLLHMGAGLANAVANLHNAHRARTPLLNVVGDHASWHRAADPPLASDIESLARPVSGWLRRCDRADELAGAAAEALAAARVGCVATLVAAHDAQLGPAPGAASVPRDRGAPPPAQARVAAAAERLRGVGPTGLYLGGAGLFGRGLEAAARISATSGCRLVCDTFPARVERGIGAPAVERLPYFPEAALRALGGFRQLIFAGARPPVSFFGYPGGPSRLVPEGCEVLQLASVEDDVAVALEMLSDALDAKPGAAPPAGAPRPAPRGGALTPERVAAAISALQPEGAIVVDESLTAGAPYFAASATAPAHTYLALTGGAIGQGLPCATGAALARPDRSVLALQADGSGLYTLQALWTQAREALDVTNLVFANRGYRILEIELARAGVAEPGPAARSMVEFGETAPEWTALARGLGVPGQRVADASSLCDALERALAEPGPHLIELAL